MANNWTKQTPGVVEMSAKLKEISLRLMRINLYKQLQRSRGMLRAMSPAKKAEK